MLNKKDEKLINAYLDDQLSFKQRAAFEARLNNDLHLKNQLTKYQHTKHLLSISSLIKSPRNFTLSPEDVKNVSLLLNYV